MYNGKLLLVLVLVFIEVLIDFKDILVMIVYIKIFFIIISYKWLFYIII